eukprot:6750040-Pyramimonas_sp.AAC.1
MQKGRLEFLFAYLRDSPPAASVKTAEELEQSEDHASFVAMKAACRSFKQWMKVRAHIKVILSTHVGDDAFRSDDQDYQIEQDAADEPRGFDDAARKHIKSKAEAQGCADPSSLVDLCALLVGDDGDALISKTKAFMKINPKLHVGPAAGGRVVSMAKRLHVSYATAMAEMNQQLADVDQDIAHAATSDHVALQLVL